MRSVCPEEEDSFFFFCSCTLFLVFLTKGDVMMMESFFLRADSKEMIQRLARMCSPNWLTAPPISSYFASHPLVAVLFIFYLVLLIVHVMTTL